MKIVIDMPEELLGKINDENYQSLISWYDTSLYCAIKDGTPLPKGHGRLIDADKYRHEWVDTFDSCYGDKCSILLKTSVDNAPTVIEADK